MIAGTGMRRAVIGYWAGMTAQPLDLSICSECGAAMTDMGLRPSPAGGQDWVYMCTGCRRDVVRQHVPHAV